jgi:hypothetical protein
METSQFEAKKIALKQTKDGHVLNLAIHPDDAIAVIERNDCHGNLPVVAAFCLRHCHVCVPHRPENDLSCRAVDLTGNEPTEICQ